MRALAPILALVLAGCAAGAQTGNSDGRELADALAGRTAGEPQRCINPSNIDTPRIVGDSILYRQGSRLWLTRPEGGCPSLAGDPILVVELTGSQQCANDRFRTIIRGTSIPGPYCRFGNFIPYSRPR